MTYQHVNSVDDHAFNPGLLEQVRDGGGMPERVVGPAVLGLDVKLVAHPRVAQNEVLHERVEGGGCFVRHRPGTVVDLNVKKPAPITMPHLRHSNYRAWLYDINDRGTHCNTSPSQQ